MCSVGSDGEKVSRLGGGMRKFLIIFLFLIFPGICFGQNKIPVYLKGSSSEQDSIGQRYIFEVKEAIRGSQGFRLIENFKQWPYIKIEILTVKIPVGGRVVGTAISYTILYDSNVMPLSGAYLTSGVTTCTNNAVMDCARDTLAHIDEAVSSLQNTSQEKNFMKLLNDAP